jgi:7-carboxy-7-deazaguanine synthase
MKINAKEAVRLPVMEHFYTIQGEGFYQGKAAYFVRLGGCNVGCTWCDVKDSWDASKHPQLSVEEIVKTVVSSKATICVITGGEPFMHNLNALTQLLHRNKVRTHVETSGAYPVTGRWNWICVSPKRFKKPSPKVLRLANELKVIVFHKNDFRFAEKYSAEVVMGCKLFLQPEWSMQKEMLPLMIDYVKKNQQWEISLQIHKYMNIP